MPSITINTKIKLIFIRIEDCLLSNINASFLFYVMKFRPKTRKILEQALLIFIL